jgi:RimJ/RimL family protein N-acetyltransferase
MTGTLGTRLAIEPLAARHFSALRPVLDEIAREKRYLAFTRAPPRSDVLAFYRNIVARGQVHFVALLDGRVCGWCDVLPTHGEARAHVGTLGIGLVGRARHLGIGGLLMRRAIDAAWAAGMTRIELTVRIDNLAAMNLYQRMGFKTEGLCVRAFRVDGRYFDTFSMALLR